jgi:7-carboxy-7-deazaguanine synthase
MDVEAILKETARISPRLVCITGGEPLLQAGELEPLLASFRSDGIEVDIETNGTIDFTSLQPYASICMDVKCPSSGAESDLSLLAAIRPEDTVKFVVAGEDDCRYAQEVMHAYPIRGEIFFSPVAGTDPDPIVRFIVKNSLPVRFQLQLHKIIGVK